MHMNIFQRHHQMWLQERPALYLQYRWPIKRVACAHRDLDEVDISSQRQATPCCSRMDSAFSMGPRLVGSSDQDHKSDHKGQLPTLRGAGPQSNKGQKIQTVKSIPKLIFIRQEPLVEVISQVSWRHQTQKARQYHWHASQWTRQRTQQMPTWYFSLGAIKCKLLTIYRGGLDDKICIMWRIISVKKVNFIAQISNYNLPHRTPGQGANGPAGAGDLRPGCQAHHLRWAANMGSWTPPSIPKCWLLIQNKKDWRYIYIYIMYIYVLTIDYISLYVYRVLNQQSTLMLELCKKMNSFSCARSIEGLTNKILASINIPLQPHFQSPICVWRQNLWIYIYIYMYLSI